MLLTTIMPPLEARLRSSSTLSAVAPTSAVFITSGAGGTAQWFQTQALESGKPGFQCCPGNPQIEAVSGRQTLSDGGVPQGPRFPGGTHQAKEKSGNLKNCPLRQGHSRQKRDHITGAQDGVCALWERKGGGSWKCFYCIKSSSKNFICRI